MHQTIVSTAIAALVVMALGAALAHAQPPATPSKTLPSVVTAGEHP